MCKGGSSGGGGTSTVTQTSQLDPTVAAAYKSLISQAQGIAGPNAQYNQYTGQMVAPLTGEQTNAIAAINAAQGQAQPYYNTASTLAGQATTPLAPQQFNAAAVQQYMDPYLQNVVNATQANINQSNQIQQSQLLGQAIQSGASPFGSDRAGIAAADLARQQDLAAQQTISGLYSQGYQQAEGEFNTQQQTALAAAQQNNANALAGAQLYAGLGSQAEQTALQGASAQLQAGTLEQQQQQNVNTNAYNQWLQQTYYPFQTTSYLANIVEGIGNQFPMSSTQTSTPAQPSLGGQIAGGALAGLGILGSTGAFGSNGWLFSRGGPVERHRHGGIAGVRMGGIAGLPGVRHFDYGGGAEAGHNEGSTAGPSGNMGSGPGGAHGYGNPGGEGGGGGHSGGAGARGPLGAGDLPIHTNATGPAGVATGQSNPAVGGGVGSNYQGAVSDYANRDWADRIGSHLSPFEEMQPNINYPSTYANGLAHWGLNPAAALGSAISLGTGVPLVGSVLGAGYTALGLPDIPVGSAKPAPEAGTAGTPNQVFDGTAGPAGPTAPQGPLGGTGNAGQYVPNAIPGEPGATVGPTTQPAAPPATTPPPAVVGKPYQDQPTVIPTLDPGLRYGQGPLAPYPLYGEAMGGAVMPGTAGHFADGGATDSDADPTPYWSGANGSATVNYPSNGESIDTGLPVPSGGTSDKIGSFFDNPWLGVAEAGLGMMASGSPFAGVAIGQGGLTGIQQYEQGRQNAAATALTQQQARQAANEAALTGMEVQGYRQLQGLMNPQSSAEPYSAQPYSAQPAPSADQSSQGIAAQPIPNAPIGGAQPSVQPIPNASMVPGQQPQVQPIPNALVSTGALPATGPNVTGKAVPMPQMTPGIQSGPPNAQPMFNLPQLAAQARVMMSIPGMSGQASSLLGMITKSVPEGMYLGQDGALYPLQGYNQELQAKFMLDHGYQSNGAGGYVMNPAYFQSEAALAGAKAGSAAYAEMWPKIVEGIASQAGRPVAAGPDQVITSGIQVLPPVLRNILEGGIGGRPAGGGIAQGAPAAPTQSAPQTAPAPQPAPAASAAPTNAALAKQMQGLSDADLATVAEQGKASVKTAAIAEQKRRAGNPTPAAAAATPAPAAPTGGGVPLTPSQDIGGASSPYVSGLAYDANGNLINTATSAGLDVAKKFNERYATTDRDNYNSALGMLGHLDYIDRGIEDLNNEGAGGWSATGPGVATRLGLAKTWNTLLQTFGGDPSKDGFDPNKVASYEDLSKESTRLGFDLAKQLGSREAQMIVQQAVGAVPNAGNTYIGARLVSQGLRQGAQRNIDFYNFETQWMLDPSHRGVLIGADEAFNKLHPVKSYVDMAVAMSRAPQEAQDRLAAHPEWLPQFLKMYGGQ